MPTLGYGTPVTIGAIFGKVTTACKFEKKIVSLKDLSFYHSAKKKLC